jgi:hypothetical protein
MATIAVTRAGDIYRVALNGKLTAADLRALELACGPALAQRRMPLEIDMTHLRQADAPARAFLEKLAARGATLLHPRGSATPRARRRRLHSATIGR